MMHSTYRSILPGISPGESLEMILTRFDAAAFGQRLEHLADIDVDRKLYRMYFRLAGETAGSLKAGGHRLILDCDTDRLVRILLIYHKRHLAGRNEAACWKEILKIGYKSVL